MTRQQAVDKIRKLQALSLRAGTAEEAASAAHNAHGLKISHGISDEELLPGDSNGDGGSGRSGLHNRSQQAPPSSPWPQHSHDPFADLVELLREGAQQAARDLVTEMRRQLQQDLRRMRRR